MAYRTIEPSILDIKDNKYIFNKEKDYMNIEKNIESFKGIFLKKDKFNSGIIGLVSKFGNGKTFFMQYLTWNFISDIKKDNIYPVYVDISKYENFKNKLLLFIYSEIIKNVKLVLNTIDEKNKTNGLKIYEFAKKMLPVASKIATRLLTNKITNIDEYVDAAGEVSESLANYLVENLNDEENYRKKLIELSKDIRLVILIDNLDRCRPEFVLDFFVLTKRMFDVDNILFIVSYDKQQIINLLRTLYSNEVDISSYMRKYIGFEYYLPQQQNIQNFITETIKPTKFEKINIYDSKSISSINYLLNLWLRIYSSTNLSIRQFQHGIIMLDKMPDSNGMVTYQNKEVRIKIILLYLKIVYPYEYQNFFYYISWNGKIETYQDIEIATNSLNKDTFKLDLINAIRAINEDGIFMIEQKKDEKDKQYLDFSKTIFSFLTNNEHEVSVNNIKEMNKNYSAIKALIYEIEYIKI